MKIKIDKNFTPCNIDYNDEIFPNGIFEFNITKMLDFIDTHPDEFIPEKVIVEDFPREYSSINKNHMSLVKILKPVILAEISPGNYNLIDGNHRMEKARNEGLEHIMAYRLNVKQHIQFLISKRAYSAFVEYWNSKECDK